MHIKDTLLEKFGGFTLDMGKIGTTSTDERAIRLPYTGELPEPYDSAAIFFRVTPEYVVVTLSVENGKRKPIKYVLEASRDEIDAILWPLFWFKAAETEYRTRFDVGRRIVAGGNGGIKNREKGDGNSTNRKRAKREVRDGKIRGRNVAGSDGWR